MWQGEKFTYFFVIGGGALSSLILGGGALFYLFLGRSPLLLLILSGDIPWGVLRQKYVKPLFNSLDQLLSLNVFAT